MESISIKTTAFNTVPFQLTDGVKLKCDEFCTGQSINFLELSLQEEIITLVSAQTLTFGEGLQRYIPAEEAR